MSDHICVRNNFEVMPTMEDGTPNLLTLPDDAICVLLRYLDATSLYFLGRTCIRLDELIRSHLTLWRRIDARRTPNDREKVSYCLEQCYDHYKTGTQMLLLRGDKQTETLVPEEFYTKINKFMKLTILALENQTIDGTKHSVMTFPEVLHELSLKNTSVTNSVEFFKGSGNHFKKLRVLILDQCDWLTSSVFIPISKYNNLEILSVYKCENLENSIAYLSLAGQGFKALKIFDARLSPLGNTLIHAIHRIPSLQALYFQYSDVSYTLDYFKRKLELLKGAPARDFLTEVNEFDLNDYRDSRVNDSDSDFLDNVGLIDYLSVKSTEKVDKLPKSVLYLDPYNQCTCGFEGTQQNQPKDPPDDDDNEENDSLAHAIIAKIKWLTLAIRQYYLRGRYCRPRPKTVINLHSNGDSNNIFILNLENNRRPEPEDEPPRKKQKTDDSQAGPSGQNSDSEDEELPVRRPPTPHPDVNNLPNERNAMYRIHLGDQPMVQIENINETRKNLKVPLRRLSLRGFKKLDHKALEYINDLDLEVLDLTYTTIKPEAIEFYLKSHPLCRVVHERYCTCPINLHF